MGEPNRSRGMENARKGRRERNPNAAAFFGATLLLWVVSVVFEILFNRRTELLPVVAGLCFFQAANQVFHFALSRDPLFVNTAVSLLHSTITSISGIYLTSMIQCWVVEKMFIGQRAIGNYIEGLIVRCKSKKTLFPLMQICRLIVVTILINEWMNTGLSKMFNHSQLFSRTWLGAYPVVCFSCGYFAYDQWDMLRYQLYSGWIPAILVHHLVLLVCFTLALYRNVTINYLILTLICELHSIFLHIRKVRRMAGFQDMKSKLVKAEWVANWATFLTARLMCHILIIYKVIEDAPGFGKGVEFPLAFLGMVGMNLLNVFLGLDLYKAYKRENLVNDGKTR